jgi:hypothetical protein
MTVLPAMLSPTLSNRMQNALFAFVVAGLTLSDSSRTDQKDARTGGGGFANSISEHDRKA